MRERIILAPGRCQRCGEVVEYMYRPRFTPPYGWVHESGDLWCPTNDVTRAKRTEYKREWMRRYRAARTASADPTP